MVLVTFKWKTSLLLPLNSPSFFFFFLLSKERQTPNATADYKELKKREKQRLEKEKKEQKEREKKENEMKKKFKVGLDDILHFSSV